MSLVLLTSAAGAPGVTTTTLGLACTWPRRALAVEADPVGGSAMLAGFFRGFLPPAQSLVDLLLAHRAGRLSEQLPMSVIPVEHTAAAVLPGPRSHAQARSALELWEPLSLVWRGLHREGTDVLIDAGRLGMTSYAEPLLQLVDMILLVTRSDLPSLAAAKQWADQAVSTQQTPPEWAVVLVGPGHPYGTGEVSRVLNLPVVAALSLDERGAAGYSHGTNRRPGGKLDRDLRQCGDNLTRKLSVADRLATREAAS